MKCQVCEQQTAKYTCPRCSVKTCSVGCVRAHKERTACDGIRDVTGYVAKTDMSNLTLLSDYRFLEHVDRNIEQLSRKRLQHRPPVKKRNFVQQTLSNIARDHGVSLRFLPADFSKHKKNTIRFEKRPDATFLLWSVEFLFPDFDKAAHVLFPVHQQTLLKDVLSDLFDPAKTTPDFYFKVKEAKDKPLRAFLLTHGKRREIDLESSLASALTGSTVFEYPTIVVEENTEGT